MTRSRFFARARRICFCLSRWRSWCSCMNTAVMGSRVCSFRMDSSIAENLLPVATPLTFLDTKRGPGCGSTSPSAHKSRTHELGVSPSKDKGGEGVHALDKDSLYRRYFLQYQRSFSRTLLRLRATLRSGRSRGRRRRCHGAAEEGGRGRWAGRRHVRASCSYAPKSCCGRPP